MKYTITTEQTVTRTYEVYADTEEDAKSQRLSIQVPSTTKVAQEYITDCKAEITPGQWFLTSYGNKRMAIKHNGLFSVIDETGNVQADNFESVNKILSFYGV